MSCNTCQSKFTFFTRENGCPSCGFSYCSKCLKYKCNLSNGSAKKVCGRCYNKLKMSTKDSPADSSGLSSPDTNDQSMAPVDIVNKLDSLENPAKPPIVIYKSGGHWDQFKAGLEPVDQELVDRLKKLKDGDTQVPPPTTEEIRRRLAILKDQDPHSSQQSINIYQTDTRTDQQKEDDLIRQYLESLELSAKNDPAKEVEQRLNTLKGFDPTKQYSSLPTGMDDEVDEETVTKNIVKKAMAEAALEAKYGSEELEELEEMEVEHGGTASSDDEVSCCMCEQTKGLVSCIGCTGDLYCEVCFEDNHDDFEMGKHKTVPYNRKSNATPD
ncbi:abscission/NoCut checkpoint regulator [Venturia canescens]|uniref:abscission/NoCut checkpoint regulator n=1 Tax=Venturia canescens TaxID=32260 RepID=UPI001C9CC0CD|nr:abscission/NoCut checkpoint regulator [Venturia canescens]XP_043280587.1 abscission/NoCut checkpoint regulator [Venturia canescens]